MLSIDPTQIPTKDLHQYMLAAVAPRPIAFVSSLSAEGVPNLAPYSFFNAFSSNPPIVVFSSNRRGGNATLKDTLHNAEATGEVVINMVPYRMARQMALASIEYPPEVDEFVKTGLTPLPSEKVKPFRVAESPVQMECSVRQIIPLGEGGGAGNLILCDVVLIHIDESVLNEKGRIDPHKIDLVGRMGRMYYTRASGNSVFEMVQEYLPVGVGFDALPVHLRHSPILTGHDLGHLAALSTLPDAAAAYQTVQHDAQWQHARTVKDGGQALHTYIQQKIAAGEVGYAAALAFAEDV